MLRTLMIQASAKINLSLWVKARRPDGYHEIETLMQTVSLQDTLVLRQQKQDGVVIQCDDPAVPTGSANLVHQAARVVLEKLQLPAGLAVAIEKRIPIAAGLAGGSADAAAAIAGIVRLYDRSVPFGDQIELAASIGSDVPFLVKGGLAVARGRGEQLTFLEPPRPRYYVVIAVPRGLEVSTAWAYSNCTPSADAAREQRFNEAVAAYRRRDLRSLKTAMFNDLEAVTMQRHPEVAQLKATLAQFGPGLALMSGSGPSVFALFADHGDATRAAAQLDPTRYLVAVEKTTMAHA